jgi:hypothetical protein
MDLQSEIKTKVTASQYERLNEILGISPHRLTKIYNDPEIMDSDELGKLAVLMEVDPLYLITEYKAGIKSITIREYFLIKDTRHDKKGV